MIIADPRAEKTEASLDVIGEFIQSLHGRSITSFDSGTTLEDVRTIGRRTEFTGGTLTQAGNASGSSAFGIDHCMLAAIEHVHGTSNLTGMTVAIQGVDNVGQRLAEKLGANGAKLIIADDDASKAQAVAEATGGTVVETEDVLEVDADIFSPCALGGVPSSHAIPRLKAEIVAGGAINRLASTDNDERLRAAGILYCPDYLANAGGIIDLYYQRSKWSSAAVDKHVGELAAAFQDGIDQARSRMVCSARVTDGIAETRFTSGARLSE